MMVFGGKSETVSLLSHSALHLLPALEMVGMEVETNAKIAGSLPMKVTVLAKIDQQRHSLTWVQATRTRHVTCGKWGRMGDWEVVG
jgi:hypothetical protein